MQLGWEQTTSCAEGPKMLQPLQPAWGCLNCSTCRRICGGLVAHAAAAVSGQGWSSTHCKRQKNPSPSCTFLFSPAGSKAVLSKWDGPDQAVSMPTEVAASAQGSASQSFVASVTRLKDKMNSEAVPGLLLDVLLDMQTPGLCFAQH